jgi:hypothetical protein
MSRGRKVLPTRQPSTNGTLQASTHRHRLSPERLVQCARAVIAGEVPSPQPHARRLTGQQTTRPSCARPTARRPHLTRDRHFPGSSPAGTASPKPLKAPSPRPSPRRHPRPAGRHRELTENARSSIPPGRPGKARGLRPTQNGTIGAPPAGQYDQPLSVQIGGSRSCHDRSTSLWHVDRDCWPWAGPPGGSHRQAEF